MKREREVAVGERLECKYVGFSAFVSMTNSQQHWQIVSVRISTHSFCFFPPSRLINDSKALEISTL